MKLEILRTYFKDGTNGLLYIDSKLVCYTIELPWRQNIQAISCIPEGVYEVCKRYSSKFSMHLILPNVKDRKWILIHPANNAMEELKGCIAPVMKLSAPGIGYRSLMAMEIIRANIKTLANSETITLTIRSLNFPSLNLTNPLKKVQLFNN